VQVWDKAENEVQCANMVREMHARQDRASRQLGLDQGVRREGVTEHHAAQCAQMREMYTQAGAGAGAGHQAAAPLPRALH
jgi:hypothetical protein